MHIISLLLLLLNICSANDYIDYYDDSYFYNKNRYSDRNQDIIIKSHRIFNNYLIFETNKSLLSIAKHSAKLSRACATNQFKQKLSMQHVAVIRGNSYGVANHYTIIDRINISKPGYIFIFKNHDTSNCQVYYIRVKTLR